MKLPALHTHDGRRALAFLAIFGGAVVFTFLIFIALYMLREKAGFVFWLAMAAHIQVLVGMTALGWAMGRRVEISASKDGVIVNDQSGDE